MHSVGMLDIYRCMWRFILVLTSVAFIKFSNGDINSPVTTKVRCETTKGPLTIDVHRDWAPLGADRFVTLVKDTFYTDIAFFRCVKRFLTQFGISEREEMKHWHNDAIKDDVNLHLGIQKNFVSFAGGGPDTRSTQIFIAFEYLDFLGISPWETPFGVVVEGQSTLDNLYKEYGDIPPFGKGPDQQKIHNRGNKYVRDEFPKTDFLLSCKVIEEISSMVYVHPKDENSKKMDENSVEKSEEISEENNEGNSEENEEEEEHEDLRARGGEAKALSDEEGGNKISRGPDELDKLSVFEKKSRARKSGNSLREQLVKSQELKLAYEQKKYEEDGKKIWKAVYAVGFLVSLLGVMYLLHRGRANAAANGKRS